MRMNESHWISDFEWKSPGEELEEGDAEGVEVRSEIDRTVGAGGRLRGDIRKRALEARGEELRVQAVEDLGELEVDEVDLPRALVDDDVGGLDVVVKDVVLVNRLNDGSELDRNVEAVRNREQVPR